MYLLDYDKLELGDIILTKSNSRISEMVRRLTKSQFSHAILYVDVSSIIDSDGYGVQSNNIQRVLIENIEDAVVLRVKSKEHKDRLEQVEFFAREKIGTEYSTQEAKIATLTKELDAKEPNRQFCTRFIAQAFESAEIELVENSNYCVPEELLNSDKLEIVENPLRKASKLEIEFANSENPLENQREIHNDILRKARELSGADIQTFEQVNQLIIDRPEIDKELTDFTSKSGYLTLMEKDVERNPWHYDSEKMVNHYKVPEAIIDIAMFFATTEPKTRQRLEMTIYALIQFDKLHPREYFKMEIELYRKLIRFSFQRENEALKVLKHF
nr:YiiX/YebB-like N1pC/P60 family cysteine hydrolase [uncultured Lacinutrix sp.]